MTLHQIYAVTDEKYKKKIFDKNVKEENQIKTRGIEVGHIFFLEKSIQNHSIVL